ncbi:hypothetical protein AK830_g203 [Neonectria ditissima]|uniref:Uncharacterized protein n=1 Tax=Neonectria ditissima TaxID=78410 RepID=A0A0P7BHJ5_9HYPO|nr:hypothetical protein AK830_g203 [Neonectria ditissima]
MAFNGRGGHRGPGMPGDRKPCFEFQRKGSCKFGTRCRFYHEGAVQQPDSDSRPSNNGPNPARDGKLREWRRLLDRGEMGAHSVNMTASSVSRFFRLGLELMEGDVGAAQEAIKLLATDAGLAFVKVVADRHIPALADDQAARIALWETEVKPMFAFITHPCVVDSAVLEQQVATVFNFVLGVGGSRMTRVFHYATRLVRSSTTSPMGTTELSLAVLSKVFDCNTNNMIHPEFAKLVAAFGKVIDNVPTPDEEFSHLQASKYLKYMQQRLDVGENIPNLQHRSQVPITRETFVLRRDLPGLLSADGPRHNNDHADITNIAIMPTYDEIVSPRGEYLPTNNPSEWHTQGIRGRLDREFRLVREDTVGQLRDAVREMLESIRNQGNKEFRRPHNSLRTYMYDFPTAIDVKTNRFTGLEMTVRCSQPEHVARQAPKSRNDWWIHSKRLQAGALVCVFDVTGSMLFCVVSETTMRSKDDKEARKIPVAETEDVPQTQERLTLSDDGTYLFVNLKLVDAGREEIKQAMRWYRSVGSSPRRYLVEFPGVLLDSFKHTLSALQRMHKRPSLPFQALLSPADSTSSELEVKPPQYARRAGFTFDLSCLTTDEIPFTMDPRSPPAPGTLSAQSTLDPTQSAGLLNTLSRELSLIQGPPGTGKSYTGEKIVKVLLASKQEAKLGPILCVCYTNHALDQLLEHLLNDATKSIIRIGSRSKSERLQNLNLRAVVKSFNRTKAEKSGLYNAELGIRDLVQEVNNLLQELSACDSWSTVKAFLTSEYPRQHTELFSDNQDGWTTVIHKPETIIDRWLAGGHDVQRPSIPLETLQVTHMHSMTNAERRRVHRHWIKAIRDPIIAEISRLQDKYDEAITHRDQIRGDVDLRCLSEADVVGVTTTGLARNLDVLQKLRCKVMLCEEAGEVLEAHILTAFLPSVEHAILIGDHLQLRPQIQNYDLQSTNPRGQQYSLDMSLFERLVQPPHDTDLRVPYSILETQRRMHPSIAELVRSTLYPTLKDAETVKDYPEVVGMKRRLFWFHHDQPEAAGENNDSITTSRSNTFEVEMTAALVSHLSKQGKYAAGDIAVLTPYLGQLQLLRRRMESMFEICVNDRDLNELETLQADSSESKPPTALVSKTTLLKSIRVATVDNFQGEEAKVIVISLVRSNSQHNCGFLKTSNRINVLLSRAQHGMYIIGNSETYKEVPMWADITSMLSASDNLGTKLELQCPRHPKTPILVSQPDHFVQLSPESGCNLPCDKRLLCFLVVMNLTHLDAGRLKIRLRRNVPLRSHGQFLAVVMRCESHVATTSPPLIIDAPPFAVIPFLVGIPAKAFVATVTHEKKASSLDKIMGYASRNAAEAIPLVNIIAPRVVTARLRVSRAWSDVRHCQQCAPEAIKSVCVDFLELKEYHEVNLDEEPCIFPDCGHFLTVSSMDGQMAMADHYRLDENGLPKDLLGSSEPFSMENAGVKSCATCRGSLRNISRYGRIVRRAMLDESTKKFISWSNSQYLSLLRGLLAEQETLSNMTSTPILAQQVEATGTLALAGSRQKQLETLKGYAGKGRYKSILKFRRRVTAYAKQVREEEQPFQRVAELVKHANLQRGTSNEFRYDQSIVQSKGALLALMLLLKLDITIFSDFLTLFLLTGSASARLDVKLDLSVFLVSCEDVIRLAQITTHPKEETQGHICYAQLCAISRSLISPAAQQVAQNLEAIEELKEKGLAHAELARELLGRYPSVAPLESEIDAVEEALKGFTYSPVTTEELREIYNASAEELSGTGHWYTCENGHPFTINNCGMPMEEATCPECGARIGGRGHVAVEGVRHATEIEELSGAFGGVRL